jgi:hypothetical protein
MKTCKLKTLVIAAAAVAAICASIDGARAQESSHELAHGSHDMAQAQGMDGGAQMPSEFSSPFGRHGFFGMGHDYLHSWYETLKQPGSGMSCCNNQDCRPTSSRVVGDNVQVEVDGEWTTVPPEKILNAQAPDLGAHVCAPKASSLYPKGYVFCVILGNGV